MAPSIVQSLHHPLPNYGNIYCLIMSPLNDQLWLRACFNFGAIHCSIMAPYILQLCRHPLSDYVAIHSHTTSSNITWSNHGTVIPLTNNGCAYGSTMTLPMHHPSMVPSNVQSLFHLQSSNNFICRLSSAPTVL